MSIFSSKHIANKSRSKRRNAHRNEIELSIQRFGFPGGCSGGETPDPIPNSAVKPSSADDTAIGGKVGHCQDIFLFAEKPVYSKLERELDVRAFLRLCGI